MKRIAMVLMALAMVFSSAVSVYAVPYTTGIEHMGCSDSICGLTGDHVNQVNRTCKKCYIRTVTVYCAGGDYERPDAECFYSDHTRPCTIKNRLAGVANAYCSYCGPYYYDAYEFKVGDYNGHIDTCTHTSTGSIIYNTCNYGPREYY